LAQETPIIILDEPTGSLDLRHQELVMSTLRGLAAGGAAVLAVLHDLNLAARYADRVGLMSGGRIRSTAATRAVMQADLLSEVYGHPVGVAPHPHFDCPFVFPLENGSQIAPTCGANDSTV
jgi:iron complex transport system ATP-binding protein